MFRKAEFQLYPNKAQERALEDISEICRQVYNWALAQRIWFYQEWSIKRSCFDQSNDLTVMRSLSPKWDNAPGHSLQLAIRRVDLAYKSFFRRLKNGENPGFPRFKSKNRFSGFGFKEYGAGWKFRNNKIYFNRVGEVKFKGQKSFEGKPKTCVLFKKSNKWFVSISYEVTSLKPRPKGSEISGLDWGVETFATIANQSGTIEKIENPRHLRKSLKRLKIYSAQLSRSKKNSKRREKNKRKLSSLHNKISNQRKNFIHQTTHWLVSTRQAIAVEKLNIQNMVDSNKSNHLNREILAASSGLFHSTLKYKAEEAGVEIIEVDPLIHKPSQTDCISGEIKKKSLNQRTHTLPDGTIISRDENAARNLIKFALGTSVILGSSVKRISEETEPITKV
jgi:putative transposase